MSKTDPRRKEAQDFEWALAWFLVLILVLILGFFDGYEMLTDDYNVIEHTKAPDFAT